MVDPAGIAPELTQAEFEYLNAILNDGVDFADGAKRDALREAVLNLAKGDSRLKAISWMDEELVPRLSNRGISPKQLKDGIEGVISSGDLKAKLVWEPQGNAAVEGFLTSWIENASIENLELFVRAVTGNRRLCQNNLEMEIKPNKNFVSIAHTCFFSLELSAEAVPSMPHFVKKTNPYSKC